MTGLVSTLAGIAVVTVLGAGIGYGGSLFLAPPAEETAAPAPKVEAPVEATPVALARLEPILTNLAHPSDTWVRTELSLMSDAPLPAGDAEAVGQDLLAFLRTLRLDQVEGPSGFLALREELDERAAMRTEGRVRRVLIRTLLFE